MHILKLHYKQISTCSSYSAYFLPFPVTQQSSQWDCLILLRAYECGSDLSKLLSTCLSFYIMIFDKENNDKGQSSSEQCLLCSFQRKSQRDRGGWGGLSHTRKSHEAPRTGSNGAGGALVQTVSLCVFALNRCRGETRGTVDTGTWRSTFINMTHSNIEFTTLL